MKHLSRRTFIHRAVTGLGAISISQIVSACAPQSTPTVVPPTKEPTLIQTFTPKPTEPPQPTVAVSPSVTAKPQATPTIEPSPPVAIPPDLVVARGTDPEQLVRQAIKAMGGMDKFVKKSAKVVVKPNICVAYGTPENAYTTNPFLVGALVKLCFEAGAASVRVMDYPFNGTPANAYVRSGIEAQVKAAGGEMVLMTAYKYVPTNLPLAKDLKNTSIYNEILKADAIINVPIAKHHSSAMLTLAMKNMMGIILDRESIHINLGQRIADLSTQIKPVLNVVDAIRILMRNGPASGAAQDVKKLDTIVLSKDIVAVDAYAASFFNLKPEDLKYIVAGADMKLGRKDLANLKIEEIKVGG
jgi:uncharacterized protein (DUF362 family)